LDFDGAVHRVDNAPKLNDAAVARSLDDAPMVNGDSRVDQVAAQRPEPGLGCYPHPRPQAANSRRHRRLKIAASFRVSVTVVSPNRADRRSRWLLARLHFPAAL
jgi:hypothetical protein